MFRKQELPSSLLSLHAHDSFLKLAEVLQHGDAQSYWWCAGNCKALDTITRGLAAYAWQLYSMLLKRKHLGRYL